MCYAVPYAGVLRFVSYALRSSEDEEVDYHEGVDEHERYCGCVSLILLHAVATIREVCENEKRTSH